MLWSGFARPSEVRQDWGGYSLGYCCLYSIVESSWKFTIYQRKNCHEKWGRQGSGGHVLAKWYVLWEICERVAFTVYVEILAGIKFGDLAPNWSFEHIGRI